MSLAVSEQRTRATTPRLRGVSDVGKNAPAIPGTRRRTTGIGVRALKGIVLDLPA
jgi:hypothetical protein